MGGTYPLDSKECKRLNLDFTMQNAVGHTPEAMD